MKFLLDCTTNRRAERKAETESLIAGQLLTPLAAKTRWSETFAIDNGCFSQTDMGRFEKLLDREKGSREKCLFVVAPDIVSSARRTLEMFEVWYPRLCLWRVALACQNGQEDLPIPWDLIGAVFIAGDTEWKESKAAADIVKAGLLAGKHVHIGRVNTIRRFRKFEAMGAHTCDGSGVSRFDWMLEKIASGAQDDSQTLFRDADADGEAERRTGDVCLAEQAGSGANHD